jgi:hypothetical protein
MLTTKSEPASANQSTPVHLEAEAAQHSEQKNKPALVTKAAVEPKTCTDGKVTGEMMEQVEARVPPSPTPPTLVEEAAPKHTKAGADDVVVTGTMMKEVEAPARVPTPPTPTLVEEATPKHTKAGAGDVLATGTMMKEVEAPARVPTPPMPTLVEEATPEHTKDGAGDAEVTGGKSLLVPTQNSLPAPTPTPTPTPASTPNRLPEPKLGINAELEATQHAVGIDLAADVKARSPEQLPLTPAPLAQLRGSTWVARMKAAASLATAAETEAIAARATTEIAGCTSVEHVQAIAASAKGAISAVGLAHFESAGLESDDDDDDIPGGAFAGQGQ